MRLINVSSVNDDGELAAIQARLASQRFVSNRADFSAWLAVARRVSAPASLDLIAHGTRRGALRLGDWEIDVGIDPSVADLFASFRGRLLALGVRRLRLLGCLTACGQGGTATLMALQRILKPEIVVLGAQAPLSREDYDAEGFAVASENKLGSAS